MYYLGTSVIEDSSFNREISETEAGLVSGQTKPLAQVLRPVDGAHGHVGHLARFRLGLEEGKVVEGGGSLVDKDAATVQFRFKVCQPKCFLNNI